MLDKNSSVSIFAVLFFKVFCYLFFFTVKVHPKAFLKPVSPNKHSIRLQA